MSSQFVPAARLPLYNLFLSAKLVSRGEIRDEVVELVGRSHLFGTEDLIAVMKAGYKALPKSEKLQFARRIAIELDKLERGIP